MTDAEREEFKALIIDTIRAELARLHPVIVEMLAVGVAEHLRVVTEPRTGDELMLEDVVAAVCDATHHHEKGHARTGQVATRVNCEPKTARRWLLRAVQEGRVAEVGTGCWRAVGKLSG